MIVNLDNTLKVLHIHHKTKEEELICFFRSVEAFGLCQDRMYGLRHITSISSKLIDFKVGLIYRTALEDQMLVREEAYV